MVPEHDCRICERLAAFRDENKRVFPEYYNAPVPSFGDERAQLLIVGLAPGLKGANRTGRPFTGDYAGELLYETLLAFGFAAGTYGADPADGLKLVDCLITNAVRCVPPGNKPTPAESGSCRRFLVAQIAMLARLRVVIALGRVAHDSVVSAVGGRRAAYAFAHGASHRLVGQDTHPLQLIDSYHCSRYNTNTGKLTPEMFRSVFAIAREHLGSAASFAEDGFASSQARTSAACRSGGWMGQNTRSMRPRSRTMVSRRR
jgi:uracil-DNA glycosylase